MDMPRPVSYDASDYLGMVRRHWWIVLAFVLAGAVGATMGARTQPKEYESTASVFVLPVGSQDPNSANGRTNGAINMDTEAQLVTSTDVAEAGRQVLKVSTPTSTLVAAVRVSVPPNTTVLDITFAAPSARQAQQGAHAFAAAYLAARQNAAQADITGQIATLDSKVKQYQASLNQLSGRLASLPINDPNRAALTSQVSTLTNQINTLTTKQNELATTALSAGRIISDAALPKGPARPNVSLFAASGGLLGLLLGILAVAIRQRIDQRVRRAVDLVRRADVPVLGELPARARLRLDDVFAPYVPAGRMFNRLRNEVVASLRQDDQVIVVTGASLGAASTVVAANLAAALGRSGDEVVLVCTQVPENLQQVAPATRMLGVQATPGLSDVLTGRLPLAQAVQRAPRNPWLRVLTNGGTASAAGLLQSTALREALDQLRAEAEFVVIEAPSTAAGADAQSLASLADAAILAVEVRRTGHAEVVDAAQQLHRVGTPLLGAVVLPRLPDEPRPGHAPARRAAHRSDSSSPDATAEFDRIPADDPVLDGTAEPAGRSGGALREAIRPGIPPHRSTRSTPEQANPGLAPEGAATGETAAATATAIGTATRTATATQTATRSTGPGNGTGTRTGTGTGTGPGNGTGSVARPGNGTGSVAGPGNGTGSVARPGNGTGSVARPGSGTGAGAGRGTGAGEETIVLPRVEDSERPGKASR